MNSERQILFYALLFGVLLLLNTCKTDNNNLTTEQKIEDFEFFYNTLKESYPYFEVNKRMNEVDWLANKEKYLRRIELTRNNREFFMTFRTILLALNNGHNDFFPTNKYDQVLNVYRKAIPMNRAYQNWVDELEKADTAKIAYWQNFINSGKSKSLRRKGPRTNKKRPSLKFFYNNEFAVISIPSFGQWYIKRDRDSISDFLSKIEKSKVLIIDIQGNEGGSVMYWREHIVPRLIHEPLVYSRYMAYKNSAYIDNYYGAMNDEVKTFADLPELKAAPMELRNDSSFVFMVDNDTIRPDRPVDFYGDIYVLTDAGVFSASESFAAFCKSTKWGTVAGERTAGDGISIDPVLITLPNSGLIARFSGVMGLNPNGSSNFEMKTEPDIPLYARSKSERLFKLISKIRFKEIE